MTNLQAQRISTLSPKLWIYTNFDCNLKCIYCVAESSPTADRRALGMDDIQRIIDEAVELGFEKHIPHGWRTIYLERNLRHAGLRISTHAHHRADQCYVVQRQASGAIE